MQHLWIPHEEEMTQLDVLFLMDFKKTICGTPDRGESVLAKLPAMSHTCTAFIGKNHKKSAIHSLQAMSPTHLLEVFDLKHLPESHSSFVISCQHRSVALLPSRKGKWSMVYGCQWKLPHGTMRCNIHRFSNMEMSMDLSFQG